MPIKKGLPINLELKTFLRYFAMQGINNVIKERDTLLTG